MNVRLKRAKELTGYAVQLTKDEGLGTMLARGTGFVKRRCFGKKARYLPTKKGAGSPKSRTGRADGGGLLLRSAHHLDLDPAVQYAGTIPAGISGFFFCGSDGSQRPALPCRCVRRGTRCCKTDRGGISGEKSTHRIQKIEKQGHCGEHQCRRFPCHRGLSGPCGPRRHSGAPRDVHDGQGHPAIAGAGGAGWLPLQR